MSNPTPSNIGAKQNTDAQLRQLAAFSWLYERAKRVLAFQFAITVPAALASAAFIAFFPELKVWAVFYALTVGVLDVVLLDRIQKSLKKRAAKIQEAFDCELMQLPWNALAAGAPVDSEDVAEAAEKYQRRASGRQRLKDWYPAIADQAGLARARLICQRASCWWDAGLRKRVARVLTAVLVVAILVVLIAALAQGNTRLDELIIAFLAPIAPALIWTLRERYRQLDAAEMLDTLRSHIEAAWDGALHGEHDEAALLARSRAIQDAIFRGRSTHPLIFNWVNHLVRASQQRKMEDKAAELVAAAATSDTHPQG